MHDLEWMRMDANASASDGTWGYSYDTMGNRKTASALSASSGTSELTAYSANRLNQYSNITYQSNSLQPDSLSPTYDLNGNMTWDGTNAYFWDLQNQLVLVSNAAVQVASAYDAMGRRVRKIVSRRDAETQSWAVEETHHFFYDGWNVVRETVQLNSLTPPNALTNYYTWGNDLSGSLQGAGGVGGLLAVSVSTTNHEPSTSNTFYPLYDHNGNVERYVSRSGATVAAFQYDAFGNTVAETLTQSGNNAFTHFRFSTKYWDPETGLYYYGYRFYRPVLGRWVNRDRILERGGLNLFCFSRNAPILIIDINGLETGWHFESEPNVGVGGVRTDRGDTAIASYEMNESEKKCCNSVIVHRWVKVLPYPPFFVVQGGRYGFWQYDQILDTVSPAADVGRSAGDTPEGPSIYGYRIRWTQRYRFEARCASGADAGKTLSSVEKLYTTEGHWSWDDDFRGFFHPEDFSIDPREFAPTPEEVFNTQISPIYTPLVLPF